MARRNRPKVVWLPPTNANSIGIGATDNAAQVFFLDFTPGPVLPGTRVTGEIPLLIDSQDDPLDPASSLADITASGYRLRRVVGKIFCEYAQREDEIPASILVTAGLIIRRSDPVTGASYAFTTGDEALISPASVRNMGDPWIWRRTWRLWQNFSGPLAFGQVGPPNNYTHVGGGNADGAHVDQKTARLVGPEERLFLNVSMTAVDGGTVLDVATTRVVADLRCLVTMTTSSGNRRNASR